jgi:pimeloyl-ACP methyl ester carboxylesterase
MACVSLIVPVAPGSASAVERLPDFQRGLVSAGHTVEVLVVADPANPAILLIDGATASMLWWEAELCEQIARGDRFVIRYDNRDTGRSTSYPPRQPGYTYTDLAGDALGLLDAHDVGAALLDDAGEPVQRLGAVVGDRAPVGRRKVVVVSAVEDVQRHYAQPDRGRDRLCGGRGGRSWSRQHGREQGQDRQDGRTGRVHQPSMAPEPPFSHPREITGSAAPRPGARSTSRARARRCGRPRGAG